MAHEKEKLEILEGTRGDRRKAAIRIADIAPLLEVLPDLRATTLSGSPTAADYNALLEDFRDVHNRLLAVALLIQGRL